MRLTEAAENNAFCVSKPNIVLEATGYCLVSTRSIVDTDVSPVIGQLLLDTDDCPGEEFCTLTSQVGGSDDKFAARMRVCSPAARCVQLPRRTGCARNALPDDQDCGSALDARAAPRCVRVALDVRAFCDDDED